MIQRIQSVYLFFAGVLTAVLFFVPFAELTSNQSRLFSFKLTGIISEGESGGAVTQASWPLFILALLILVLLTATIFRYKNRPRQIYLAYVSIILLVVLTASMFFSVMKCKEIAGGNYSLTLFFAFPLVAALLVYLAIRGIAKDDRLVKSVNRIR